MIDNFNIHDNNWDPVYPHHSLHTDTLHEISDSLDLEMFTPINPIPTRYADNTQDSNLVINLMFLQPNHREFDRHQIILELCKPLDHASLVISIAINEEHIHMKKQTITKDSKNEKKFIKQLGEQISNINTSNIADKETLENVTQELPTAIKDLWNRHSKTVNITRHSKEWWNEDYRKNLATYQQSGKRKDWKIYRKLVKLAKQMFFDKRIQEIALLNKRPWDLMNWVKKCKLPTTEAIKFNGQPCNNLDDLWYVLYHLYNSAQNRPINLHLLNEIPPSPTATWPLFSDVEVCEALNKCSNSSTPGPDHCS